MTLWDDLYRPVKFNASYKMPNPLSTESLRLLYGLPLSVAAKPEPVKPAKGDKVTVTVTGYVEHVYDDGTIEVVDKRSAFGDDSVIDLGTFDPDWRTVVRVVEKAPAAPKVGDVITYETLNATPWRRGTIITTLSDNDKPFTSYVLLADGKWLALSGGGEKRFTFAAFNRAERIRVGYAPGK